VRDTHQAEPKNTFVQGFDCGTRFLLSMLLISAGLTTTSLLLVQAVFRATSEKASAVDLRNSVSTFENSSMSGKNADSLGRAAGRPSHYSR